MESDEYERRREGLDERPFTCSRVSCDSARPWGRGYEAASRLRPLPNSAVESPPHALISGALSFASTRSTRLSRSQSR